jgi:predicted metal-binding membrane protein
MGWRSDRLLGREIGLSAGRSHQVVGVAFGAGAYVLDLGIHRLVESDRWLHTHWWLLLVLPLIAAGIYQFTPLKYMCLDKCRSPFSFITES